MTQPHILILGVGRVGRAIALDLASTYDVTALDRSAEALESLRREAPHIRTVQGHLNDSALLNKLLSEADLVITAVPGNMGYRTLERVIQAGKKVVDISFFPEDPYTLEELAREKGATVIVDAGVAPGLSNFLLGYELAQKPVESFVCYVGGLPVERSWPFQYKAPFSPADVIEEYTRPVRQRIGGVLLTKAPLSDLELINIPGIGVLEGFNTDGLRTLLRNTTVPTLIEKTLRYPGHAEYIQVLAHTGFFSTAPITISGQAVVPREITAALLSKAWEMSPEDEDLTIMVVRIQHVSGHLVQYTLIDRADTTRRISSMARTTGYTCTALAKWLLEGATLQPGIHAPEELAGDEACFAYVMHHLATHGIQIIRQTLQPLP